ncbi:MAG: hypothetical protein JNL32_06830 [Candidatus Kapabacteria bacterium]|nr:hypothetical protein [Candidatus Kapabacteria bacterium]
MKSIQSKILGAILGCIMLTLACTLPSYSQDISLRGTLYAKSLDRYNGMKESGGANRGVFIDIANKAYAYLGAPYCASGQSKAIDIYNAEQRNNTLDITCTIRSGRARAFITEQSIDARDVYYKKRDVPDNSFVIYKRSGGGHISYNHNGKQFHFNSTPQGLSGSQWNGTWSGWKQEDLKRQCSPLRAFRITHFTLLT